MRILFVPPIISKRNANYCSEEQVGAIEQQVFGLASTLSKLGHETFVTRSWHGQYGFENLNGVNFLNFPITYPDNDSILRNEQIVWKTIEYCKQIRKKINQVKPEVLITHTVLVAFLLSDIKLPKIFITHNNDIFVEKSSHSYFNKKMLLQISKKYDAIVALTPRIRRYLGDMNIKSSAIIPNAIDPAQFTFNSDDNYILCASRLVKHKRIEDLIQAFSKINDNTFKLIIIGDGPERTKLVNVASKLGLGNRIEFLPFLTKSAYRNHLSKCSFFAFPSEAEAFGVVVMEAMACCKPVIASKIIGPADIITHGYDGLLFKTRNISELTKYLELLINDNELRKKIGINARKTIEANYAFEHVCHQYLVLFNKILEN